MRRVLAVVAHPDDELLGPGGTLLRHREAGDEVAIHIECSGVRDREARLASARTVADWMGATLTIGTSPELPSKAPALTIDADIVYTHHAGDLNRAHRLIHEAVLVACRPYTANVQSIRAFETPSSTEWGAAFTPTLFVDIDATLGKKIAMLAAYQSEMRPWPHPRSEAALRDRARYWGSVSGLRAAEPFVVVRERW
jgi:LmbE family N-acetylglucosaminyl deacetylase